MAETVVTVEEAVVDLVINVPQALAKNDQAFDRIMTSLVERSKDYGLDDTVVNVNVIPNLSLSYSSRGSEG